MAYHQKGFSKLISNYRDTMTNPEANAEFSEFIAEKIRARVADPVVAEKLTPTDHGLGMRRPPMETFYYEAYNQPHVQLVDLNETPIVTITGLRRQPHEVPSANERNERIGLPGITFGTAVRA